ncbi:MAG: SPOR domain-containing protein [Gammaproteobacteria bacterium]|nr:SPOR domain-containing protein [Gammaproteobacteria bacterium]
MRNNGQSRFTNQRGWRCAVFAATAATCIAACQGPAPEDVLGSRTAPEDDWFCDGGTDGQWDCVQDRALVANPQLRKDRPVKALVPTESARPKRHPVLEWPAGHYAVQLIALDSDEAATALAERLAVPEVLRVRLESGGRLFHVLLLGDYADRRDAEVASARMVRRMPFLKPWVRRVGPLQGAVRRAQQEPEAAYGDAS